MDPALQIQGASEYRGQVTFGGLPVPGATVTATQGSKKLSSVTNQQGVYVFPQLTNGTWTIEVEMTGFSTITENILIAPKLPPGKWELRMLPLAQMKAETPHPARSARHPLPEGEGVVSGAGARSPEASESPLSTQKRLTVATPAGLPQAPGKSRRPLNNAGLRHSPGASETQISQLASPGFLINGSVNNAATSPFALPPAFGNHRSGAGGLYNGGIGVILDNSALDAAPFSLSGQRTPKPVYNRVTGVATFGGPLNIPHLLPHGPTVFAAYEWTRSLNDTTDSALVPDSAERDGDFSQVLSALGQPVQIFNPATGLPFPGNVIPQGQISPQARALLNFYPLPNFSGNARYNYQIPINSGTHQDALQSRFEQTLGAKDELYGGFAFESSRTRTPNLFGFLDTTDQLGINTSINWSHRLNQGLY
ncbi:MAG: carboxypeptidase-like regulatory domain-containing protein, partial [Terriglobia bacterium]